MITIYNSNLDFDLDSSNSITLSSTSNMVFKTNGADKMSIVNNGISVSGNVVVSGLITSTGAGFSGIGAGLSNIPISAINELRLELNGGTTDLSITRDTLNARIVSEAGFGSNYTNRINSELNTRVDNTSNYVLSTSNILIGRIINTSNYIDSTSNFLSGRIDNTSNYVLATSNILIGRIDNTSNYVLATSNILIGRLINTSNYVDSTSNFLAGRIDNTSNYVLATSNILIGRLINTSNYVDGTSNFLSGRIDNTSNYVLATSNILIGRIINTSNYVESTSNILIGRIINTSNYVDRINTALTTAVGLKQDILTAANTIGVLNTTTDFVVNGSKIELTKNTSNYVDRINTALTTAVGLKQDILTAANTIGVLNTTTDFVVNGSKIELTKNTSNYVDRINTALTSAVGLKQDILTAANTIGILNTTTDFVVNGSKIELTKNTSNYVLATSNILIGRVMNTSNYVSSYKPATAVRADTADKLTTSRKIANVPFDGSADINIPYNNLNNILVASTGINIDANNYISATYASADLISIFNTTDFANVNSKIELTKNTSNYVDRINTALTTAIAGKQATLATAGNVGIGTTDTSTYKLNVSGTLNTTGLFVNGTSFTGSSQWVGTTNIYNNTGNVGIGTTDTSTAKLFVNGNLNTTGYVGFVSNYSTLYNIGSDKVIIFTKGSYTINVPSGGVTYDILMIGGGGGGGAIDGGGGGAGACIVALNQSFAAGNYTINVGNGGIGGIFSWVADAAIRQSANGGNTTITNSSGTEIYRAVGGGKAGSFDNPSLTFASAASYPDYIGRTGGCGGGGGNSITTNAAAGGGVSSLNIVNGITGISPSVTTTYGVYGNAGGNSVAWSGVYANANAAGGGGIGAVGANGVISRSGAGGDGLAQVTINSTSYNFKTYFAPDWSGFGVFSGSLFYIGGGGGGGGFATQANQYRIPGGLGGGGIGDYAGNNNSFLDAPGDGVPNTGSGGGGACSNRGANGGSGGSGLVIIRYRGNATPISIVAGDLNIGYKMGTSAGEFNIISSQNNTDTDYVKITSSGAIYNPSGSASWTTTSDQRIKENIEEASYDKCYENINNLRLYRFSYIKGINNVNKDIKQLGFIAQEVKEIFPKAISTYNFNNDYINIPDLLSIDITQINLSLYGAVKKLIKINNDNEGLIKRLIEMDNDKESRIKNLELILNTSNM